jgi:hypothetical protein
MFFGGIKCNSRNDGALLLCSSKGDNWVPVSKDPVVVLECKKGDKKLTMAQVAGELIAALYKYTDRLADGDPEKLEDAERMVVGLTIENVMVRIVSMHPTGKQLQTLRDGQKCDPEIEMFVSKGYSLGDDVQRESLLTYIAYILAALTKPDAWPSKLR